MNIPPLPEGISRTVESGFEPHPEVPLDGPFAAPNGNGGIVPPRRIKTGAYLISYRPTHNRLVTYDGTLRVENIAPGLALRSSGDLYQRPIFSLPGPTPQTPPVTILGPPPNPANGIPILPISRYKYYVRVTSIPATTFIGTGFTLGFQLWKYDSTPGSATWTLDPNGPYSARMTLTTNAPAGFPTTRDYLEGDVRNAAGSVTGRLTMGWLTSLYRKITVEVDTVSDCPQPLNNGAGITWQTVFNEHVGYDINLILSQTNLPNPPSKLWSTAEMHAGMLKYRNPGVDFDKEWYYHILVVPRIEGYERGVMYDNGATDSNKVPREGVGICSDYVFDNTGWGLCNGKVFSTQPGPYFRTAIHELGHSLGLLHHPTSLIAHNGYMNTTDVIAQNASGAVQFPNNIIWAFAPDYLRYLRHYPDILVRPGGLAFGSTGPDALSAPSDEQIPIPWIDLKVEPVVGEVPLGAPVRVNITLRNICDYTIWAPTDVSLSSPYISGHVRDVGLTNTRSFTPLLTCADHVPLAQLARGESVTSSLTLLRGAQGALFPSAGVAEVTIRAAWPQGGPQSCIEGAVEGKASVLITGTVSTKHAETAHKVLTTPDLHLVMVLGGDHLEDGIEALHHALRDETLRPHYAVVEARRLARRFMERAPDVDAASELVKDKAVVISPAEMASLMKLGVTGYWNKD